MNEMLRHLCDMLEMHYNLLSNTVRIFAILYIMEHLYMQMPNPKHYIEFEFPKNQMNEKKILIFIALL